MEINEVAANRKQRVVHVACFVSLRFTNALLKGLSLALQVLDGTSGICLLFNELHEEALDGHRLICGFLELNQFIYHVQSNFQQFSVGRSGFFKLVLQQLPGLLVCLVES
jgi:hypothetical protein